MATTMTAPVANSISLAQRFLPLLDEKYKAESKTALLDLLQDRVEWIGASTVRIYSVTTVGLGQYSRNAGFVPGDVDGSWETYTISVDRGRSFTVDVMDNDETLGMAFGTLLGEFERVEVVPEVDAYRFAKYVAGAGNHAAAYTLGSSTLTVTEMIQDAIAVLDDAEVPTEGRILFVSANAYKFLKSEITRFTENGDPDVNGNVEMYNDMRVIRVPKGRFNTGITLGNPSNSYDIGGYTTTGADLNFVIVHPSAILQVVKHQIPRIFSPEVNQEADAWKLNYRIYHDCFVKDNKVNGIYFSAAVPATPMTAASSTASISGTGNTTVNISNAQGSVTAVSSNTAVCTAEIVSGNVKITGVAPGTANVVVTDAIGQSVTIAVTVS